MNQVSKLESDDSSVNDKFQLREEQFNQLYLPLRDSSLSIYTINENLLSKKLLYYSWETNEGVVVRKIILPKRSSIDNIQSDKKIQAETLDQDSKISKIIGDILNINNSLIKWRNLSLRKDLSIDAVLHILNNDDNISIIQPKRRYNLESLIQQKEPSCSKFDLQSIIIIFYQLLKILTILEENREFHLNITSTNLLSDVLNINEFKLTDFGVRHLYLKLYFEIEDTINQCNPEKNGSKSRRESYLIELFENSRLNKALIEEIRKYKQSDDQIEKFRSIFMFFDRISLVTLMLRIINLISLQNQDSLFDNQLDPPLDNFDLVIISKILLDLINKNQESYMKKLLMQKEKDQNYKIYKEIINCFRILLGPPDFIIAQEINQKQTSSNFKAQNIRVAYQALMIFHENQDLSNFIKSFKSVNLDLERNQLAEQKQVRDSPSRKRQRALSDEVDYFIYFTNKFTTSQRLIQNSSFFELRNFILSGDIDSLDSQIQDVQSEVDIMNILRTLKQEGLHKFHRNEPKQKINRLIIVRMNKEILTFLNNRSQIFFNFAEKIFFEYDLYGIDDASQWIYHIQRANKPILSNIKNINKIGEQSSMKLTLQLINISSLRYLSLNFNDSLVSEKFFFQTLILIVLGLPLLKDFNFIVDNNTLGPNLLKNDQDFEESLSIQSLQLKYLSIIQNNKLQDSKSQGDNALITSIENLFISLTNCQLNDKFIEISQGYFELFQNVSCFQFDISHNPGITDKSIQSLAQKLQGLQLKELSLKLNSIETLTYYCVKDLDTLISKTKEILELSIEQIKLSNKGTEILSEILKPKTVLLRQKVLKEIEEEYSIEEVREEQVEVREWIVDEDDQKQQKNIESFEHFPQTSDEQYEFCDSAIYNEISTENSQIALQIAPLPPDSPIKRERIRYETKRTLVPVKRLKAVSVYEETQVSMNSYINLKSLSLNLSQVQNIIFFLLFQQCSIGDKGLETISIQFGLLEELKKLSLNLEKNQISHIGSNKLMINISNLEKIEQLNLNFRTNRLGINGLDQLSRIRCLANIKELQNLNKFNERNLNLYNNQIQDKGMNQLNSTISKLSQLKVIDLNVGLNQLQQGGFALIRRFLTQTLHLESVQLDMSLNILDQEPQKEDNEWQLRHFAKVCMFKDLKLNFSQCQGLTEDYLIMLHSFIGLLNQLKSFTFNGGKSLQLDGKPLKMLKQFSTNLVDDLNLNKTKINDQEIDTLANQINKLQQIQDFTINLAENDIKNSLSRIGQKLGQLKHLIFLKIDVSKNPFFENDSSSLFIQNLSQSKSLECLDLSFINDNLYDDHLIDFGKSLRKIKTLKVLHLEMQKNFIKQKGATTFGDLLMQIAQLKSVTLDFGLRQNNVLYDTTSSYRNLTTELLYCRFN